jgi:hypothetical protein
MQVCSGCRGKPATDADHNFTLLPSAQPEAAVVNIQADAVTPLTSELAQQIQLLGSLQRHLSAGLVGGSGSDSMAANTDTADVRVSNNTTLVSGTPAMASMKSIPSMATDDLYWLVANQMRQVSDCLGLALPRRQLAC